MGQILFWLEASVASILFVALGLGMYCRIPKRRWLVRFFLEIVWGFLAVLPWVVVVAGFAAVEFYAGGAQSPLIAASAAGGLFVVAWVVLSRYASKPSSVGEGSRGSTWRLPRILLAWGAAAVLTGMTFWNLDLAVRQEMASMRLEAGAMALSLSPARIPDSQNAALLYRQASEVIDAQDPTKKWQRAVYDWLPGKDKAFDVDDKQMLDFLRKQGPAIDLLRKAAELPGCNFGIEYKPPSVNMVMPPVRALGHLLCLSSRVAAHQGRMSDAMKDLDAAQALANHSTADPIVVVGAMFLEDQVLETFQYVLAQAPLTGDSADVRYLNPYLSYRAAVERRMQLERAFIAYTFTLSDTSTVLEGQVAEPVEFVIKDAAGLYRVFLWRDDVAEFMKYMQKYEQLAALPFHQSVQELQDEPWFRGRPKGLLNGSVLPSFSSFTRYAAKADASHRIFILGIAMERYRLAEGSFPSDLGQLVPKYLPAVPVDPYSGKPLKMVQAKEQVTIYSVGSDLKDDGGKPIDPKTEGQNPPQGDITLTLRK